MGTKEVYIKISKTTLDEINALFNLLREISDITNEQDLSYVKDLDFEEYPILREFILDGDEEFVNRLFHYIEDINTYRIHLNLTNLLNNCTDPTSDNLEFHPSIKKGLELYYAQKELGK